MSCRCTLIHSIRWIPESLLTSREGGSFAACSTNTISSTGRLKGERHQALPITTAAIYRTMTSVCIQG